MKPLGLTPEKLSQSRRCRQCFVIRPLSCYLNKNRSGLCVICDKCRESQRRRYYRSRTRKQNQFLNQQSSSLSSCSYSCSPNPRSVIPFTPYKCLASFSSLLKDLKPISINSDHSVSTNVTQSYVVPFSKWIIVKPFLEKENFHSDIFTASVVIPSRKLDLNSKKSSLVTCSNAIESPRCVCNDV